MAIKNELLQNLINIMSQDNPPAFFLNKGPDISKFALHLFNEIEKKRSYVTAITREALGDTDLSAKLQFSNIKHESRINALYRLIGLPTEADIVEDNFSILNANKMEIKNRDDLSKYLASRELEQLTITFNEYLKSNTVEDFNKQINIAEDSIGDVIYGLFDPNVINPNRLFPVVQFSKIQNIVETANKISSVFASVSERYINGKLTTPPFLESVIVIRLLKQSGGTDINTQGAVEDIILQSLGFALGNLSKQYNSNQQKAEALLKDGIAFLRGRVVQASSPFLKQANINANTRQDDGNKTEADVRSGYTQQQLKLYEAVINLLPIDNDIIPIGTNIDDKPTDARGIKENALTGSFLSIINDNLGAIQRSIETTKKVMKKRQLTQDKLEGELGAAIGQIGGISLAEIIIVIASLFVLDENDLVGLIPRERFNELIINSATTSGNDQAAAGATTGASSAVGTDSSSINNDSNNSKEKQINIFDTLKQFKDSRHSTLESIKTLQDTIGTLYEAFKKKLAASHEL